MKGFPQPTQWPSILKLVANSFVSNLLLERGRKAFLEVDNDQTVRRALIHRRHPSRGMYQQGEWVMIGKKSGEADGNWHGPMQVITQEGSQVVWVRMGTKLFRVAPEHVRSLSAVEEWKHQNKDDISRLTRSSNSIVPRHGGTQYHDLTEGQNIVSEPNPGAAPLGASPTVAEDQEQYNHPEEIESHDTQSQQPDGEPDVSWLPHGSGNDPSGSTGQESPIIPGNVQFGHEHHPELGPVDPSDIPVPEIESDEELYALIKNVLHFKRISVGVRKLK